MPEETKLAPPERIRDRRIVRWSIAYAGSAWVLLQVAELLFDIFDWPSTWLRVVTIILVGGFFAMLVLTWFHGKKGRQRFSFVELLLLAIVTASTAAVVKFGDWLVDEDGNTAATISMFEGKANRRATANDYYETDPSWSPDSRAFAFVSERSGNSDIWLLQRSGQASQLTFDASEDAQPAWSPNGNNILFVSSRHHGLKLDRSVFYGYTFGGDIWSVPAFGGTPRKLVADANNPAWSPDGRRFAFDSSRDGPRRIWTATADGQIESVLSTDESDLAAHIRPAWSPDGQWLVYERQAGTQASAAELVLISVDGRQSFRLTDGKHRNMSPAWAGPASILFASDRGGALNLWQIDVDFDAAAARGEPVQVTLGAGEDFAPAVAVDGTLAYATSRRVQNLWKVDVDPVTLEFGDEPERIMSSSWNDLAPALASDNAALAFSSDRAGRADIWILDSGSRDPRQITNRSGQDLQPVWSPDGSKLAFFSDERGKNDIWILPLGGGPPVVTTPAEHNDINPYWSSDGSEIGFMSDRSGQSEVWRMNADGSNALKLTDISALGHTARWSPDDNWILFTSVAEGDRDVWAVHRDGGPPRRLTTATTQDAHGLWSPDGRTVLYLSDHQKVFARDFDQDEHRLVFDLDETIDYVHLSPDGKTFVFTRQQVDGDIWLIE